jgi:hypothetical protein
MESRRRKRLTEPAMAFSTVILIAAALLVAL